MLVVDDEPELRAILAQAVDALGHRVRTAANGESAWEKLCEHPADVVLSDWEMPLLSGLDLCRRVRQGTGRVVPYTYFVLMTGHDRDRDRIRTGMEAGADDFQRKPLDLGDLGARLLAASRVVALHRELARRTELLEDDTRRLFDQSRTDALTGLGNRARMIEELDAAISRGERYGERLSLAMCDLDHFKAINDGRGHLAGDDAIAEVARVLRKSLRASDGVFRYGGDELAILFVSQSADDARTALERIRADVESLDIRATPGGTKLTLSIGVAERSVCDKDASAWIARADVALYRAKSAGRNQIATEM